MNKPVVRTALRYAVVAGSLILLDLAIDHLLDGATERTLSHFIFAALVVPGSILFLSRAMESRRRAEAVLRQARDELEIRVQERTAELAHANAALQAEIVERRRTEQEREHLVNELQLANNMLHALVETMPVGVLVADSDGGIILANPIARTIMGSALAGIGQGQRGGQRLYGVDGSVLPPEELPLFRAIQHGESTTDLEALLRREDGGETYVLMAASPVHDQSGRVISAVAILQDITERKRNEAQIAHLSSFPQLNPNPVLEIDAAGAIVFSNSAATSTLQRLGLVDDRRVFLPGDLALILQTLQQNKEAQLYREVRVGSAIFGETVQVVPAFNTVRLYASDITQLKSAEQHLRYALAESQQHQAEVSALLASARTVLEQRGFEKAARSIFDTCKNLLGATGGYVALIAEDGTQNRPVFLDPGGLPSLSDPSLPVPIRGLREQACRTGRTVYENDFARSEWAQFLPEGHLALENVLFAPLTIRGTVIGLLGLTNKAGGFNDNDVRLAAAFAELAAIALENDRTLKLLQHSEQRFRSVVQAASDAIITVDSQGSIVLWNSAAERIFGYRAVEMIGQPFVTVMPQDVREAREGDMRRALAAGTSTMTGRTIESRGVRKGGREFPLELSLTTWQTNEGVFFTSTIRDITERKQAEAELSQAQAELAQRIHEQAALEERQRLARELHDSVSQALYGISLGTHTALALFHTDETRVLEALNYVLAQAQAGLTEMRALIFELRPESLQLEGLVAALHKQAAALRARHSIEVELSLCDEPDAPLPVKEALYRIAQEAQQNAVKHAQSKRLDVRLIDEAQAIRLEVCDHGVGFDPAAPYPGHLGLRSMCERALRVGGTLEIDSVPGCGTRILARVPIPVAHTG